MKKKRKIYRYLIGAFACCMVILSYYYWGFRQLEITQYKFETRVSETLKIVQLTDLHNREFGKDNSKLIQMIAELQPDVILLTGDMLNRDEDDVSVVCNLVSRLSQITTVYYGYGNHEVDWQEQRGTDLFDILSDSGAVVLDNEFVDVEIKGTSFRIGGYMGYYRQPGMLISDSGKWEEDLEFADDFENTDNIKILLNHIPTQWVDWGYIDKYAVDYVFCGHYHGGVMRIPFVNQGVYAPYVGWFPPYTKGVFVGEKATCVLSAGLGTEYLIPRLNNPPEIVVVELEPLKK